MVADELKKDRDTLGVPDEELNDLMRALASKFKKEKGGSDSEEAEGEANQDDTSNSPATSEQEPGQTGQLVFFQEPFVRGVAELVAGLRKKRLPAYRYFLTGDVRPETDEEKARVKARKDELKKRKAELKKEERAADTDDKKATLKEKQDALLKEEESLKAEAENKKEALKAEIANFVQDVATASKSLTVDIGLFGRMTTSELLVDVEAACQVAHAISTHETLIESDFFTAMDDRTDKPGAAFMGTGEHVTFFNSAVYYKYLNLDIDAMRKHPPSLSIDDAARAAGVLVSAAALANPTGKQNSFAAHGVPELILVEVSKAKRPVSYANAFLQPVEGGTGRNLMTESAKALHGYIDAVAPVFAPADVRRVLMAVGHASSPSLKSTNDRVPTLDNLVKSVVALVAQSEDGGPTA